MHSNGVYSTRFILLFSIGITWVAAVPVVQVGTSALRRDMYGPARPEFFSEYVDDHGPTNSGNTNTNRVQQSPQLGDTKEARLSGNPAVQGSNRYFVTAEGSDRLGRNLDQIGGGNLLRRALHQQADSADVRRWFQSRRNLDQIGGGNLLRNADDRQDRNLDHIGGGNLVRDLNGLFAATNELRRNLDQIGGGNLVRSLTEMAGQVEPVES